MSVALKDAHRLDPKEKHKRRLEDELDLKDKLLVSAHDQRGVKNKQRRLLAWRFGSSSIGGIKYDI